MQLAASLVHHTHFALTDFQSFGFAYPPVVQLLLMSGTAYLLPAISPIEAMVSIHKPSTYSQYIHTFGYTKVAKLFHPYAIFFLNRFVSSDSLSSFRSVDT